MEDRLNRPNNTLNNTLNNTPNIPSTSEYSVYTLNTSEDNIHRPNTPDNIPNIPEDRLNTTEDTIDTKSLCFKVFVIIICTIVCLLLLYTPVIHSLLRN
ncbi:hypothetical protein NEIG_01365 [Nematocida sp. ERTm5]|nr:hypothetical protein NEIG_01365 [Nematocida sp. ERTm5]